MMGHKLDEIKEEDDFSTTTATMNGARELAEALGGSGDVGVRAYPLKAQDVEVLDGPQHFYDTLSGLIQVGR